MTRSLPKAAADARGENAVTLRLAREEDVRVLIGWFVFTDNPVARNRHAGHGFKIRPCPQAREDADTCLFLVKPWTG